MNIHLISSMRQFDEDITTLRKITEIIKQHNGRIAYNWFEAVKDRQERNSVLEERLDWQEIVENNVHAISQADALIVEGSRFNYSQGYQTAIALEHNKPVLNLYRKDLKEYKEWPDKMFVSGISHPLFANQEYTNEKDLEKIVTEFIRKITPTTKRLDLQLTLENAMYAKLDKLSKQTGKNTANVIKDIISRNLDSLL